LFHHQSAGHNTDPFPIGRQTQKLHGSEGVPVFDSDVEVTETKLPGIGLRHDFQTEEGRRVGVVSRKSGRRDLVVFGKDDPDACSMVVSLNGTEADALAQFLGSHRVVERLKSLTEQVESLITAKIPIAHGTRFDGLTLGATKARTRTGTSIVALMHEGQAIASPGPDQKLFGGDILVVVGTNEGIDALREIVAE
jgi:TrkA domain protein